MKVTLFRDLPSERWWSMERYADELERALPSTGCTVDSYVLRLPLGNLNGKINALANQAWRTWVYPLAACLHQSDVNHIIDHSYAHLVDALDAKCTVVTCHDIAPLALNEGRGSSRRLWEQSFRTMLHAAHIIADSNFTRDEVLRYADYPSERITVVPLAVGPEFFEPVAAEDVESCREQYHLRDHYVILHIGTCAPRKNIKVILDALTHLRDLDIYFIQLGGEFSIEHRKQIKSHSPRTHILQLPPTFGYTLRQFYQLANLFLFPSYYEGFGMPVLEAMASGTPVITSNVSSLPEVAGDAAILTNPHDSIKLAEQMQKLLTHQTLADDLRVRGLARAKLFTWAQTAQLTFRIYEQILKEFHD